MSRRARRRTLWLVCGVAALAVFGPGLVELAQSSFAQRRLDRRLARLNAEQEQLTREQARLTDDPTYVEGMIRSTFKWAQKGEYVIPLDAPPSATQRSSRQ